MRNWLKGIFGSTEALAGGITTEWAEGLRTMLAEAHFVDDSDRELPR